MALVSKVWNKAEDLISSTSEKISGRKISFVREEKGNRLLDKNKIKEDDNGPLSLLRGDGKFDKLGGTKRLPAAQVRKYILLFFYYFSLIFMIIII